MDNETKLSKEQINSIRQELSDKKENININDFMDRHLSEKQKEAVSSLMNDPERLKTLMNSPLAQKLMEKFTGGKKE